MSRTKNSIRIVVASTICQIVIMICGLVLPPLLISNYGSEINGLLSLVKQLMSYFGIVCLGLGVSAQVALYKPIADNDWKSINSVLAAAKIIYNKSGYIFAFLIFVSSAIIPFVIKSSISDVDIALVILITGVGSICEYVIISKYKVFLSAIQKQYINSRITAEGILLNTIVSVLLIKCNSSIILIQIGSSIVYILRLLFTIRYVKKEYPKISFTSELPAMSKLENRWTAFFYQISSIIIDLSPMIIVSLVGTLNDASVFSIYYMVISSLTMIAGIFASGLQAPFGDLLAKNEFKSMKKAFASFEFVYTLILSICFVCGAALMSSFIAAYIHNDDGVVYVLPTFSYLFFLYFYVRCLRRPFTTIIEAKGLFRENNKLNIVEAILFIFVSVGLMYFKGGIISIAISGCITALPRTLHYILFFKKNFSNILKLYKIMLKVIITIIISLLINCNLSIPESSNVFLWMFSIIPYFVFLSIVVFFAHLIIDFTAVKDLLYRFRK
jgi:O-antigen/teichoic acid export membrane protein